MLVIDDSESDNFLHQKIINEYDCTEKLVVIDNCKEALAYIKEHANDFSYPSMMLLDIHMPGMDAWEFLNEYAKQTDKIKQSFTINLISHSASLSDHEKAVKAEIQSYVEKPLSTAKIDQLLRLQFPECL